MTTAQAARQEGRAALQAPETAAAAAADGLPGPSLRRLVGGAALAFVLLAGALLALYWWPEGKRLAGDEQNYQQTALAILAGGDWFDRYLVWPPLQGLFMAAVYRLAGPNLLAVQLAQLALLAACGWLLARICSLLGGRGRAAAWAGIVLAVNPLTIAFATWLWPEILHLAASLLLALCLARLWRQGDGRPRQPGRDSLGWVAGAGIALGLCLLSKSLLTAFWPLLLLPLLSWRWRAGARPTAAGPACSPAWLAGARSGRPACCAWPRVRPGALLVCARRWCAAGRKRPADDRRLFMVQPVDGLADAGAAILSSMKPATASPPTCSGEPCAACRLRPPPGRSWSSTRAWPHRGAAAGQAVLPPVRCAQQPGGATARRTLPRLPSAYRAARLPRWCHRPGRPRLASGLLALAAFGLALWRQWRAPWLWLLAALPATSWGCCRAACEDRFLLPLLPLLCLFAGHALGRTTVAAPAGRQREGGRSYGMPRRRLALAPCRRRLWFLASAGPG